MLDTRPHIQRASQIWQLWQEEPITGIDRLTVEVFRQAVREAAGRGVAAEGMSREEVTANARAWLVSEGATAFIRASGFLPHKVHKWVLDGCPIPELPPIKKQRGGKRRDRFWGTYMANVKENRLKNEAKRGKTKQ